MGVLDATELYVHFKMAKIIQFVLCAFYHNRGNIYNPLKLRSSPTSFKVTIQSLPICLYHSVGSGLFLLCTAVSSFM